MHIPTRAYGGDFLQKEIESREYLFDPDFLESERVQNDILAIVSFIRYEKNAKYFGYTIKYYNDYQSSIIYHAHRKDGTYKGFPIYTFGFLSANDYAQLILRKALEAISMKYTCSRNGNMFLVFPEKEDIKEFENG